MRGILRRLRSHSIADIRSIRLSPICQVIRYTLIGVMVTSLKKRCRPGVKSGHSRLLSPCSLSRRHHLNATPHMRGIAVDTDAIALEEEKISSF